MKYRKQSHCVYHCVYHIVLVTKYRRKVLDEGIFAYLRDKLDEVRSYYPELEYESVNHDRDHIHLMVWIPPKMSVGSVIRVIKSNTSRGLKQKYPHLKRVYWGTDGIWSDSYFVSTVGSNESAIRRYIEEQGKEDTGQALLEVG